MRIIIEYLPKEREASFKLASLLSKELERAGAESTTVKLHESGATSPDCEIMYVNESMLNEIFEESE